MVDTDSGADIDNDTAAGWDAIDGALARLYPGVEPKHIGTLIKWSLGGPDPLDGISIYRRADHWHFITYGMSELFDKESDLAEESGWGFEFTFRLACAETFDTEPPMWAANFLQNLARYVFSSGNAFDVGHHVDLNGPISLAQPDTAIRAITFAEDPELGAIETPNGRVRFIQVVGLTLDEYAIIERWNAKSLLDVLAPHLPLLVTDLARANLADDPRVTPAIEDGIRRDGSDTGSMFVQESGWRTEGARTVLTLGANTAERIARVLTARLPNGAGLAIEAANGGVLIKPGEQLVITELGDGLIEIELPARPLIELTTVLHPRAGLYQLASAPNLAVEITKSRIRDQEGNVIREVG